MQFLFKCLWVSVSGGKNGPVKKYVNWKNNVYKVLYGVKAKQMEM